MNQAESGVTAQYRVFFKSATAESGGKFTPLEPGVHKTVYERVTVKRAVQLIRDNPILEGVVVRDEFGLYNVVTFVATKLDPMAFTLYPPEMFK